MDELKALYEFINLAEKNRKYPANTAHGRRAALKLFETVLHLDEMESLDLIQERMKEIYLSLIGRYKDKFSIKSLNTYKGRFLKVIQDYKRYGTNPEIMANWEVKLRKNKDKIENTDKDIKPSSISFPIHRGVYKIRLSLADERECAIEIPPKLTKEDAAIITKIINSLTE